MFVRKNPSERDEGGQVSSFGSYGPPLKIVPLTGIAA
jgi:hypothetical protein